MNRSELGQNAAAATGPAIVLAASAAEVNECVRDARWRLEGWQELVGNVLSLLFEECVSCECVSREKASNESDVRLEDRNVGGLLTEIEEEFCLFNKSSQTFTLNV